MTPHLVRSSAFPLPSSVFSFLLAFLLLIAPALAQTAPNLRVTWRASVPQPTDALVGADENLAILGDRAGDLSAFQTSDGKPVWQVKLPSAISSTPALTADLVLVGDEEGTLHAFSRRDASARWTCKTGGQIVGRPAITGDRVLFGSYDTNAYCLNLADGKLLWQYQTQAQVHAPVTVVGDIAIVGGCDGKLRALGTADGKERWATDLGGAIAAAPLIWHDKLIAATMTDSIAMLDQSGKLLWMIKPLKESSPFTTAPAAVGDLAAFAADDGQLVILKAADGAIQTQTKLVGKPTAQLLPVHGQILVGADDGKLVILDPATAAIRQRITLGGTPAGLTPAGTAFLCSTTQGTLWSLKEK